MTTIAGMEMPAMDDTPPEAEAGYATLRSRVRDIRRVVRGFWPI